MPEQLFEDNNEQFMEVLGDMVKKRIVEQVNKSALSNKLKSYELEHLAVTIFMKEKDALINKYKNS